MSSVRNALLPQRAHSQTRVQAEATMDQAATSIRSEMESLVGRFGELSKTKTRKLEEERERQLVAAGNGLLRVFDIKLQLRIDLASERARVLKADVELQAERRRNRDVRGHLENQIAEGREKLHQAERQSTEELTDVRRHLEDQIVTLREKLQQAEATIGSLHDNIGLNEIGSPFTPDALSLAADELYSSIHGLFIKRIDQTALKVPSSPAMKLFSHVCPNALAAPKKPRLVFPAECVKSRILGRVAEIPGFRIGDAVVVKCKAFCE
ncbi:hypothetical protein BDK51DRAFT_47536 [Blyttiomyces helicus]|uniref:Uncharacterized protein n=1 Tax=Blyttiomyces helicus TaxID=388810 RepID=A0A4P9W9F5_9FUNG|nr:hypothetical protein BDK51DRAFT_47536 [Blyttiomyces helicus]|eukprot:RKO88802.1 hypothetical protein BDK51DRAFT_47536 [Blyttiomyces helicus]